MPLDTPDEETPLFREESTQEDNLVRVRIWKGNPGHISINTRHVYMSFWPNDGTEKRNATARNNAVFSSYDEDKKKEGRPADYVYDVRLPAFDIMHLYLLQKITLYERKAMHWSLFSEGSFEPEGRQYNCVSFTLSCLRKGGFGARSTVAIAPQPIFLVMPVIMCGFLCAFLTLVLRNALVDTNGIFFKLSLGGAILSLIICFASCLVGSTYNLSSAVTNFFVHSYSMYTPKRVTFLLNHEKNSQRTTDNTLLGNGAIVQIGYESTIDEEKLISDLNRIAGIYKECFSVSNIEEEYPSLRNGNPDSPLETAFYNFNLTMTHFRDHNATQFSRANIASNIENNEGVYSVRLDNEMLRFFDQLSESGIFEHLFKKHPFAREIFNNLNANNTIVEVSGERADKSSALKLAFTLTLIFLLANKTEFFIKQKMDLLEQQRHLTAVRATL